jgi:hypothetical protein
MANYFWINDKNGSVDTIETIQPDPRSWAPLHQGNAGMLVSIHAKAGLHLEKD